MQVGVPTGFVFALEGTKGGPVREFGRALNHDDYMKLDPEMQKRTIEFIRKNAAAKKAVLRRLLADRDLLPRLCESGDCQRRIASRGFRAA